MKFKRYYYFHDFINFFIEIINDVLHKPPHAHEPEPLVLESSDPKIFFWIAASVAEVIDVNPNVTSSLLGNDLHKCLKSIWLSDCILLSF